MKVRYYGFLSPGSKVPLEEVRGKIELAFGFGLAAPEVEPEPPPQMSAGTAGANSFTATRSCPTSAAV